MHIIAISFNANAGGLSSRVSVSATNAQSIPCTGSSVLITVDVNCFMRMGANPVAVVDADQILLAGNTYRVMVATGQKLAFIGAAAGNAYITQES